MDKLKRWRANCVVTYSSPVSVKLHREAIHAVLRGIAMLRGVECRVALSHPFDDGVARQEHTPLQEQVSDLVYFRSTSLTKISSKDFRKLIDHVFDDRVWITYPNDYMVYFQFQKVLPMYPFPT